MDTQFVVYVYDGIPVDRKKKKKELLTHSTTWVNF